VCSRRKRLALESELSVSIAACVPSSCFARFPNSVRFLLAGVAFCLLGLVPVEASDQTTAPPQPTADQLAVARHIFRHASDIVVARRFSTPVDKVTQRGRLEEHDVVIEVWRTTAKHPIKVGDDLTPMTWAAGAQPAVADKVIVCLFDNSSRLLLDIQDDRVPLLGLSLNEVSTAFKRPKPSN
jgi:hypothetical protein